MTETQWHNVWLKLKPWATRSTIAVLAMLLVVGGFMVGSAPATGADTGLSRLDLARTELANCQLLLQVATSNAQRNRANNCITDQTAIIKALTATPTTTPSASPSSSPSTSPSSSPSPTVTTPTPTTPPPTTPPPSPSPSPTVGPTGRVCAPFPVMPDASCTGVPPNTTLHSCNLEIRTSGQYDSCLFSGSVQVMVRNVTITRSRIMGRVGDGGVTFGAGGQYDELRNLRLVDVEVAGGPGSSPNGEAAIGPHGWSCLRCNVHDTGRGANFGTNVRIEDSWFHDFVQVGAAHMSAAGSNGGQHVVILHNNLDCQVKACSGALVAYGDFDPIDDITYEKNLLNSPGSYCLYAGSTPGSGKPFPIATNVRVIDNLWGRKYDPGPNPPLSGPRCGQFGPVSPGTWQPGGSSIWTGNRWQDGSGTINP